jgi:putative FmdB family regulatory protein
MPIFEYICKECQHEFEALIFGKQRAACPKCQSQKLESQLSVFAAPAKSRMASEPSFSSPSESAGFAGGCGTCGDPRGPGSCSLKDLN